MSNTSRTDWARIDAMSDDNIDTSDSPPLSEEFFAKAQLRLLATEQAYPDPDLTEVQKQELDRRIADYEANPNDVLTWDEIKAAIKEK